MIAVVSRAPPVRGEIDVQIHQAIEQDTSAACALTNVAAPERIPLGRGGGEASLSPSALRVPRRELVSGGVVIRRAALTPSAVASFSKTTRSIAVTSPTGVHIAPKGKRKGHELSWRSLASGEAELTSDLVRSLSKQPKPQSG